MSGVTSGERHIWYGVQSGRMDGAGNRSGGQTYPQYGRALCGCTMLTFGGAWVTRHEDGCSDGGDT